MHHWCIRVLEAHFELVLAIALGQLGVEILRIIVPKGLSLWLLLYDRLVLAWLINIDLLLHHQVYVCLLAAILRLLVYALFYGFLKVWVNIWIGLFVHLFDEKKFKALPPELVELCQNLFWDLDSHELKESGRIVGQHIRLSGVDGGMFRNIVHPPVPHVLDAHEERNNLPHFVEIFLEKFFLEVVEDESECA